MSAVANKVLKIAVPSPPSKTEGDVPVVAEAATGEEVLRQVQRHRPDVVLLDLDMPEGGRHIDNELFVQAMTSYSPPTEREHDVLECTLQGLTVVQTSETLHLSTGAVRDHLSSAVQKTATQTRREVARYAREKNWI